MPNLEEIIAEAQRTLTCPVCGRKYSEGEIKLRGTMDDAYIIQTVCDSGHPPLVTIFVATLKPNQTPTFVVQKKQIGKRKITTNDVIDSHLAIEKFDGDFKKLWSK